MAGSLAAPAGGALAADPAGLPVSGPALAAGLPVAGGAASPFAAGPAGGLPVSGGAPAPLAGADSRAVDASTDVVC